MKKRVKIFIVFICIVVVLGGTVGGLAIFANRINDKTSPNEGLSSWMDCISNEKKLKEVVIPGAHDAATQGMAYVSETQSRTVGELLSCGVRYFDIRVTEKKGKLFIFHGPITGTDLQSVLDDIVDFLDRNPSEILILDFQHFGNGAQQKTLEKTEKMLEGRMVTNTSNVDDVTFIDTISVGSVRGKCVVFVGEDDGTYSQKSHFFKRNNDEGTLQDCPIASLYYEKYHKGNAKKFREEALPKYIAEYKKNPKGLFVLQCQITDGLMIFGPKFRESQQEKAMNEYVKKLKDNEDFSLINIVMRDFLSPSKCAEIIRLNLYKNTVKADRKTDFEKRIA